MIVPENIPYVQYVRLQTMRYLGIDFGSKRIGVAVTNDEGLMAFPHSVIKNDRDVIGALKVIIEERNIEKIIIGHSLNREGNTNKIHKAVESLVQELTLNTGLPIELEPEQYTTQEAVRFQGKTEKTDASAASIILNSYLTREKHNSTQDDDSVEFDIR